MVLPDEQIEKEIATKLDGNWEYSNRSLTRSLMFENFRHAFSFMTAVAFVAEEHNHHPDWNNIYKVIDITLWTHSESGVTAKDIKLAEAINALYRRWDS